MKTFKKIAPLVSMNRIMNNITTFQFGSFDSHGQRLVYIDS